MIYKPEHVTDLESGAIIQVEVLEGDHADTKALSERVASAVEVVDRTVACEEDGVVGSLTADKGYFAIEEIAQIQSSTSQVMGMPTLPAAARKAWPPRCEKLFIVPLAPSRASLGRRFCASGACTWNAASSTPLMKAECAGPPSREQKISLSDTRLRRPALT